MESILDIFSDDAFSTTALTGAIQKVPYKPQLLGQMGIFTPKPIRGRSFAIEQKARTLRLIETSALGAPPAQRTSEKRDMRDFRTVRLAEAFTLYMHELDGIRAFGETTVLEQVQVEYMSRAVDLINDMDLTREHQRLGAIQGKVLDADGTSVIYDYFDEFGITEPTPVSFALATTTTNLRVKCHELTRSMARSAKGRAIGAKFHGLCGDEFFDKFVTHPKVERQYENWSAATRLSENLAWGAFEFGGIYWHNYRGTDDNSTVAVPTDEAVVFPVGGCDIFQEVQSPAEFDPWINTLGQSEYVINVPDRDRGSFVKGEIYAYPLYFCAVPDVLRRLTL